MRKFLAVLFDGVTRARNRAYDMGLRSRFRARVPVVSIGNVTAGGNGKTPLVIYLWSELRHRGWCPVVVTRGYGGRIHGPHLVSHADTPEIVGDEPCLMAHRYGIPVVVDRDRFRGAEYVADHKLGDVVILDDGFQHRRLERDIDIVSINVGTAAARESFVKGEILPLGLFREDRSRALRRAHIVVLAERRPDRGSQAAPEILGCLPTNVSVYRSFLTPRSVTGWGDSTRAVTAGEIVAFCGIAQPEGFFETLVGLGFAVKARRVFADHYRFTETDLVRLRAEFPGIPLVCTEKDALKFPRGSADLYVLGIETKVYPSDAFISEVDRMLHESTKRLV